MKSILLKMDTFLILILGIALTLNFDPANGVCCSHYTIKEKGRVCGDCRSTGFYDCCGVGYNTCNAFCCNCNGGTCTGGDCDLDGRGGGKPPSSNKTQQMSSPIDRMDTNGDEKASKAEVLAYMKERKAKEGNGQFLSFAKPRPFNFDDYDHNKDGFLTLDEVDSAPK